MMLHEKIRFDLTTLGYKGMLQSFEENLELKTLSSSFQQSLHRIIQAEVSHRSSRSLAYRLDLAKLPQIKTLEQFDLNNVSFDPEKLTTLCQYDFIQRAENILIIGGSGTGKTHIALSLGYGAIQQRYRVKFYRFSDLAKQLQTAKQSHRLDNLITILCHFDLFIIDELGYLPVDQSAGELLFELFTKLYETTSVMITTHLSFDEWDTIFGNKKSTKAIIDRLTHHCHILETGNKSWRLKSTMENQQQQNKEVKGK